MSMLGKVLAVFNVLAALLFLYILGSDYGQQQSWAYADFRHELVLTGLPVDSEDKDEEGILLVDKISDSTAQQMFQGVGGEPKKTLRQEVDRVKAKVTSDLASLENEKQKRDKLKQILGPMASTGSERDALLKKIETAKLDDLTGETGLLNNLFNAVSSRNQLEEKADPFAIAFQGLELKTGPGLRDPGEMRGSVAHLLFNCASDDKERERVAVVVGIKAYANEVNRETDALYGMVQRVRLEMQRDLSGFEARQPLLVKAIQDLAEEILEAEQQLKDQTELYESHNSLAMQRETDLNELKKKLAGAREATVKARELLAKEQKFYFEAEGKVGQRAKENQKLEQEIRTKEKVGGER
jgi:hypothetical protein